MSKLKHMYVIKGTATVCSGTRIGAGDTGSKIGGCDNPVIRDALSGQPYIPGSSIKGAMRHFIHDLNSNSNDGKPCGCGRADCIECKMFGANTNISAPESGKTRLRVVDMPLNDTFTHRIGSNIGSIIETKTSTACNYESDRAFQNNGKGGSLRNEERIAPNAEFDAEFVVRVYASDNETEIIECLKKGIRGISNSGIGSKTSSGSGKIKFDLDWKHCYDVVTDKEYSL
ncbi:MAG: type III-A CRISPR-associated RAMP protein Csm3 [Lachnospiraceae bacterium]|nr:type III-A CRISPR-associated RAMP protein Csm3 [Lachnospiraceae bacterium]